MDYPQKNADKRGRDLFLKYKHTLLFISFVFKLFPKSILLFVWSFLDLFAGKLGVGLRYSLLRNMIKECGDNVYIGQNVEIRGWENLVIGNNVSIHRGCYIDASGGVSIGNEVSIAHQTSILSFNHTWDDMLSSIRDNAVSFSSVNLKNDIWIGCGVRILAGVTVESRVVIAAGSVVTKDVSERTIVAGVPAKFLRNL